METILIGNRVRGRTPLPCGEAEETLVIASIGTSSSDDPVSVEVAKASRAADLGAGAVTDHSFYGDIPALHRALAADVDCLISTVTSYEWAAGSPKRTWRKSDPYAPIYVLQQQVERGIDMVTVHASILRSDVAHIDESARLIPTTSKGGGILGNYMRTTGRENPYFEYFDEVLQILKGHGVTLSLGTTFRPASVCDSWDVLLETETERMGELVKRAKDAGVPVMVEGLGHASIDTIPTLIRLARAYCGGVPYRILPMATDRALGFDHISGAIGTAVAVSAGASAVTAMSRAEHIGLPTMADLEEAIIATKIAAACGQLARGRGYDLERQMARTRWIHGCQGDWSVAIHPEGARDALESQGRLGDQMIQCAMCGDFCGITAGRATVRHGPGNLRDA